MVLSQILPLTFARGSGGIFLVFGKKNVKRKFHRVQLTFLNLRRVCRIQNLEYEVDLI